MPKLSIIFRCIISFTIFELVLLGSAWAGPMPAELEITGNIQRVTVYPDRALINKEAKISLQKGENHIRLTGITRNLIDNSVQVSLSSKGVKIANVSVEETYLGKTDQDKVQKLRAAFDGLQAQIAAAANEIAAINSSISFLQKIMPFPENARASTAEIGEHMNFIEKSMADNLARRTLVEGRLKKLNDDQQAIRKELDELTASTETSKNILLTLISEKDTADAGLDLSYIAMGAGWEPQYDVRVDSAAGNIELYFFASINQFTGEDWQGVNTEISTARPAVGGNPPELAPWQIDIYQPPRGAYDALTAYKSMAMEIPEASMAGSGGGGGEYLEPELVREATSVSFRLPNKVDIMSDNKPYRFLILSASKKAEIKYQAVPALSEYAYLSAEVENPFTFPVLTGEMNIFLDSRFVSSSRVNKTIIPEEKMQISLGIDEGIKVERKDQRKFTEYSGTFSKSTVMNFDYAMELTNGKNTEVQIAVRDAFPVSLNEKIKVELKSPAKNEAEINDDGIILWNLKLAPGEKKKLQTKFMVEFPKDLQVTGLD